MTINNLEIKKLPKSEVEISFEISAEDFEASRAEALKELGAELKVDGFRPGNIPAKIVEEKVGAQAVLERMSEVALRKAYPQIIEENKLDPINRPVITITKVAPNNPLGLKIVTAVMPVIELPDYKSLAKKAMSGKDDLELENDEVEKAIDYLRKMRATKNDKGEDILPELTDEFAKSIGKFETVAEMKKVIGDNMKEEKKVKAKEKKRVKTLDDIIDDTKMEIPQFLIDGEKRNILEEMKSNVASMGLKWEEYLKNLKKNEEEIMKDFDKDGEKRVKYWMILAEIGNKENIKVEEDELESEVDHIMSHYQTAGAHNIDRDRVRSYAYGMIRNEKVFKFLETC